MDCLLYLAREEKCKRGNRGCDDAKCFYRHELGGLAPVLEASKRLRQGSPDDGNMGRSVRPRTRDEYSPF